MKPVTVRLVAAEIKLGVARKMLPAQVGVPVEATWSFGYDISGNRTRAIDPVGHRVDYRYDPWDRLIGVDLPGDAPRTSVGLTLN